MSNYPRRLMSNTKSIAACALLLLIGFNGIANAALSGIPSGYPRFIANKTYVDYYQASGSTYYFDAYNVNNKVFWQDSPTNSKEKIKGGPDFYAQVDIDASDPSNPQVLAGSFFEMWGKIPSSGAPCYLTKFRDSCRLNSFTYAANGRCPERPASVTTTHKSRFVITPSNGWTAIRNAILASLARYRALRLSELPCRLSGTKNHHFASAPFP